MAPKKKGKANKLARMSEEEKLRYLQHRAAVEEEAKRRKEHIISSYMKNKLKHEDAFTRLNTAKINQQWRQTLRHIKNKELHDATETLRQVFEVALKTKNKIIDSLSNDLDNSEKAHSSAVNTHLVAIDKMLGIQSGRMDTIQDNYNSSRDRKMIQASKERERSEETYENDKDILNTMIFWEKKCNDEKNEDLKQISLDYRNDVMHQLMSETRELEIQGKQEMEELRKEMQNALAEYRKTMGPFQAHYKELLESDRQSIESYLENHKIIEDYKEQYDKIQEEMENKKAEHEEEIKELDSKIKDLKAEFRKVRKQAEQDTVEFQKTLQHLSTHSNAAIDDLKETEKLVDSVMHYVQLSRRYLNEKEKNLPNIEKDITDENIPLIELTHLWTKYGDLQVEVTNLEAYYANYLEENTYLKSLLQQYMNTVARPSCLPNSLMRNKELEKQQRCATT